MVALAPPTVRRPTQAELALMERGLPTDRQVQDWIADRMLWWLVPALRDLGNQVWERIRREIGEGKIKMPIAVKAGPDVEDEEWWREATRAWQTGFTNWSVASLTHAVEYQAQRYGFYVDMRLVNQAVLDYTTVDYWPNLIGIDGDYSVVANTRQETVDIIRRWERGELAGGQGLGDLSDALAAIYGEERAKVIAITEATRVYATGNIEAWLHAATDTTSQQPWGIVAMQWQTARDEMVCDICRPLNGKQVLLNQDFPVPGGRPPAHPRCRCNLSPVRNYNAQQHPDGVRAATQAQIDALRRQTTPAQFRPGAVA